MTMSITFLTTIERVNYDGVRALFVLVHVHIFVYVCQEAIKVHLKCVLFTQSF